MTNDLLRTAQVLAKRIERMRIDGGDPREASSQATRFRGHAFPPDSPKVDSGWVSPTQITPLKNSFTTVTFNMMLAFKRSSIENTMLNGVYPLSDTDNPFGILHTMTRYTYAGLEEKLGGDPFADVELDAYTLGASTRTNSGQRQLNVDMKSMELGEGTIVAGGTPIIFLESTMDVRLPVKERG